MKILIPAHSIELTGEVQRCLLIAEHQGFDIKSIELGVSPTHYFSLIADHQSLDIADCQYLEESQDASIELFWIILGMVLRANWRHSCKRTQT